jgi:hypothetical protein
MSQITRSWLAFAAIGAAIIHLALVISSPLPLSIALAALGTIELSWGVTTLAKDRIVFPRAARVGAMIPVIAWSLLVVTATLLNASYLAGSISFIPMGIATLFELFVAGMISAQLRRERSETRQPGAVRYLAGMFVGAILVAGITTPALAFTTAGIDNPHAAHYLNLPGHTGH